MQSKALKAPLTDEEYEKLDALLGAPGHGGRAMDVSTLEGFLTAVVIGPTRLTPEQWLPRVWDKQEGTTGPSGTAEDIALAQTLVMRHYHHMADWLAKDPGSFEPIFECGPEWGITQWCVGFLKGMQMDSAAWAPLLESQPDWFAPFERLGASEAASMGDDETERWMARVTPSVIQINGHYAEQHQPKRSAARDAPKVGRNDPCPCGSGKKYKKCCATVS
ncbi:UPF0149 family protein [Massilia glaciei]|uniref:YecA family protein n=1 Tax=Massilia glaciei TaxID=1524097 RepID=A0A2U2HEK6_9BURK|nr:UPF0149 family protein [Massilia glaciei]PWF42046.1 YecA family protein [Massilia glaciei]